MWPRLLSGWGLDHSLGFVSLWVTFIPSLEVFKIFFKLLGVMQFYNLPSCESLSVHPAWDLQEALK